MCGAPGRWPWGRHGRSTPARRDGESSWHRSRVARVAQAVEVHAAVLEADAVAATSGHGV